MNKFKWLAVVLLIVSILIPCQNVRADGNDDFDTNISIAENEDTNCYDIDIEVYNAGKNFTGRMELQVGNSNYYGGGSLIYVAAVSLPEKSTKQVHFSVPRTVTSDYSFNVNIAIKDEKNKPVHSNVFNSPLKSANSYFNVGILSNNPDALSYLDLGGQQVWIATGDFSIRHTVLKASSLADDIFSQKIVIIDGFDTSTLTQDEIDIIMKYVREGGVLFLGTGTNVDSLKGFDSSFTDVTGTNGTTVLSLSNSGNKSIDVSAQSLAFNYNGYTIYNNFGQCGYSFNYGDGAVISLFFSLADSNLQGFEKSDLADFVSSLYEAGYSNTNFLMDKGELLFQGGYYNYAEYMDKPITGNVSFLVPIIIVYIFLIGPGLYLILKKFDKREKCWIVIPGIALVFTLIIFLFSLSVAVTKMNMKSISIRKANSSNVVTYVSGYSPKTDRWDIGFSEKYYTADTAGGYYYGDGDTYVSNSASGVNISYQPSGTFDDVAFTVFGKDDKIGDFTLQNIGANNKNVTGSLTNNTGMDLDYVMVLYNGCYTVMSDVKNGENVDIGNRMLFGDNNAASQSNFLRDNIRRAYKNEEYDYSAELSALAIVHAAAVANTGKDFTSHPIVIGVTKSDNIINMSGEESSYTCVYMD
ncbi:MAG: hypothetical protein J6O17_08655 [Eubacterium sp.]|nr:hypothetical protein [Eubacterium sp.]